MTVTLASRAMSVKRSPISTPTSQVSAQTTLVIIDSGVEDYAVLAAGVLPNAKAILLDAHEDGIAQITAALQAHPHTTHLHIVAHGSPGCLYLGNTQLSLETLDRYSWELQSWFDTTAPSLCLYACNVASGEVGTEFLTRLHQLTGAAIAASTRKVGHRDQGGTWTLDVMLGQVTQSLAFRPEAIATYTATLASIVVFDNGTFVDTIGGSGSESDTAQATLSSLGYTVSTFTGITAAEITAALTNQKALLIPELEVGDLASALDTTAQAAIRNFVGAGGTLILHADSQSNDTNFLNSVFGFSLTAAGDLGSYSLQTGAAAGTPFANDAAILPSLSATSPLEVSSLPTGAKSIYQNGSSSAVALIPYSAGNIIFMGWDWYNAAPLGSSDSGWLNVLDSAAIQATNHAPTIANADKVAILGAPSTNTWLNDVVSKVQSTGLFTSVDSFLVGGAGAITPTLTQLQSYDSVLVFSDTSFLDATLLGNNLADYVDAGGGVVLNTFANTSGWTLGGRWSSGNYNPLQPGNPSAGLPLTLGTIFDPTHPVMQGVTSFNGGSSSYHSTGGANSSGTVIANWSNGQPLVVDLQTFNGDIIGLNFYPPSSDSRSDFWTASTSGALLMGNALEYAGGGNSAIKANTIENAAAFTVDLLTGAFDADGDVLNVSGLTLTSGNGAGVTLSGNNLVVNPNAYDALAGGTSAVIIYNYNIIDGKGGSVAQTATITIQGINDAPTFTSNAILAATPEDSTNPSGSPITTLFSGAFQDVDAGSSLSGVAVIGNTANSTTEGTWQYSTDNGANWFDVGVVAEGATALALSSSSLVRFVPVTNYNGTPPALTVRAIDNLYTNGFTNGATRQTVNTSAGNSAIAATTNTISTSITPVNDPAIIGGTVTGSVTEDGTLDASGSLTVNDVDAGETGFVSNTEVSGTYGFFNFYDDGTWSYTADNASLQSLGEGQSDTDVFTIQTLDGTTQNITITVNGVNDAPELTGTPATLATAVEDTDYTLYATDLLAGFTDVDGDTPTVSGLTATNGTLVDNLDGTWTFTPNAQFNGVVNLSYNVVDGIGGSTPATQSFTVTAVNDAPSLTANITLPSVPEDSIPTGQAIASLVGPLFSDADLGDSLRGIAVVGNTANATTEGKWQYSTDGATWVDIGSVTDGATALALAVTTQLRFLPVANYNGTPPALTIRALDNTYNGSFETTVDTTTRGGSTAIAGTSNTISTTFLPVADVIDVSATTPDGFYNAGDTIAITVTFDEIVNVTGTPQLTLNTGGSNAIATYDSGSGSNQLTFLYTVAAGDTSADLDYLSVTALSSNGGSIRNAGNLDANLNLPSPGATSSLGANKNLIIDTTPPPVPVIVSFSDDSGIPKDNITNDTVLTLNGTAEANSTVTLLVDGAEVTPFKVDDTGNWTYTTEVLSEGSHTFSAIATDAAGNSSTASSDLSVLVDITAPFAPDLPDLVTASDTGRSSIDNITNDTTPTFSGIAEADSTVSIYNGISLLGSTIANATGNWSFTTDVLPAGNYSITTQITDVAGNISDPSPTLDLVIDTVAPAAPSSPDLTAASDRGISSTDNLTSETKPTFTGTAEANAIVEVFSDTQSLGVTTADSTGKWNFTATTALPSGTHSITAQATDVSGNTGPLSNPLALTIQTVVPTTNIIKITPDVRDSSVGTVSLQFSETITGFDLADLTLTRGGATIALTGATLTTQDNRTWTLTLPDALTNLDGRYKLSIAANSITSWSGAVLSAGASDTWLVGYTATALAAIKFRAGKRGLRMQGTQNADKFRGTFYDDVLKGLAGNDTLIAGYGKAQFGVDRLYGGAGDDTLISGRGNDLLYGEAGDDLLLGGDRNDRLDGGSGNDRLLGGEGNDILIGGTGDDTLTGGKGRDTFAYKTLNDGTDVITDFNSSQDLIDLRSIMRQPAFGGDNPFARFMQYVQLQQVGANTEVQIDADGSGAGQTFTTLMTLKNTTLNTITSRNFIVI